MVGEVKEECGVAAVYLPNGTEKHPAGGASYYLYKMLIQMQNRGQLSAGITTYNNKRQQLIDTYKKMGLVNEAFHSKVKPKMAAILKKYSGDRGIGHVRYATSGTNDKGSAQPLERHHGRMWKWFSIAQNGNLANFSELKESLKESNYHLIRDLDSEVILHFIAKQFLGDKKLSLEEAFNNLSNVFDGSYNLVYINAEGSLVALRDPFGFRPLSYMSNEKFTLVASESVAFEPLGVNNSKTIKPGEMLVVENGSVEIKRYAKSPRNAHCMFEWIYFANPSSTIDGRNVYQARRALGVELAKIETLEVGNGDYIVSAVPDTSRPAADAYAHEVGLESMEGLMRNRYVGRTFIETGDRYAIVKEKFTLNRSVLKGKKVILVDDSIVRGTTLKSLAEYIKKEGKAKEVHLRISCAPVRGPCFYGVDMPTMEELIAPHYIKEEELRENAGLNNVSEETIEGIRKEIGADSLIYNSVKGLVNAIGLENREKDLCLACVNCDYPTKWGCMLADKAKENMLKKIKSPTHKC